MTRTLAYTKLRVGGSFIRRGALSRASLVPGTYKPDATNTGAFSTSLPDNGSPSMTTRILTHTSPVVIENQTIWGDLIIRTSAGTTIRNCILRGGSHAPSGATAIIDCNNAAAGNVVVEDCTFYPQVFTLGRDGIVGHDYEVRRCNISGTTDGMGMFRLSSQGTDCNVTAEANYIHDLNWIYPDTMTTSHTDGTHNDCIQVQGGANIHINGNNLAGGAVRNDPTDVYPARAWLWTSGYNPVPLTGSCLIVQKQSSTAALSNVVIENNYFSNAWCGFNMKPGSYTFQNNWFVRGTFVNNNGGNPTYSVQEFATRGDDSTTTFVTGLLTSNRWTDNGALLKGAVNGGTRFDGIRWNNIPD